MLKLALVVACCAGARKHNDGGARNGSAKIPGRWIGKQRPVRTPAPVAGPVWLAPDDVVDGPLLAPLNGSFPRAFAKVGHRFGARPFRGNDRWLRVALREAKQNRSRVLKVVVLGGSPAAGEGCREPLDGDDDDFAWLYDPRTRGSFATCAWPARLARYLSRVANVTALVFNMAHGGSSSETFLANGEALFREKRKRSAVRTARGAASRWARRKLPPVVDDADLVLLAFLANDFALGCGDTNCFGERSQKGLVDFFRRARSPGPTVALVDAALQRDAVRDNLTAADYKARHRAFAKAVGAPLVDAVYATGGRYPDAREDALADAFALHLAPAARSILDDALRRWAGFGHYAAAYHEWMAACVFYALIAPALDDDDGPGGDDDGAPAAACDEAGEALALCHLAEGAATALDFDVDRGAAETARWRYGEDVPGKPGWVSCNGAHEIAFDVVCERGDLVVGFLESYDPRMGAANVTAAQAGGAVSKVVDGKDLGGSRASIFAMRALTGLAPGAARVTVRVLPRKRLPDGEPKGCASFLATTPTGGVCCLRDKFKLLSLACT